MYIYIRLVAMKTYFLIWSLNYFKISETFDLTIFDTDMFECFNSNLLQHIHVGISVFNFCRVVCSQTVKKPNIDSLNE